MFDLQEVARAAAAKRGKLPLPSQKKRRLVRDTSLGSSDDTIPPTVNPEDSPSAPAGSENIRVPGPEVERRDLPFQPSWNIRQEESLFSSSEVAREIATHALPPGDQLMVLDTEPIAAVDRALHTSAMATAWLGAVDRNTRQMYKQILELQKSCSQLQSKLQTEVKEKEEKPSAAQAQEVEWRGKYYLLKAEHDTYAANKEVEQEEAKKKAEEDLATVKADAFADAQSFLTQGWDICLERVAKVHPGLDLFGCFFGSQLLEEGGEDGEEKEEEEEEEAQREEVPTEDQQDPSAQVPTEKEAERDSEETLMDPST